MKTPIKLSLIASTLNCLPQTREFLSSLEATKPNIPYEVIIIDNASNDGTREVLSTLGTPYRTVLLNQRRSYAANNNHAAKLAKGEILVLLNNDLILTPGWLTPMLELIQNSQKQVGAVGNIQIQPKTGLIDHAGISFDLGGIPFHIRKNRKRLPPGAYRECNAVTGACMLIKRDLFLEMKGFNEDYKNSSEDIDLCVRLRLAGYCILVSHESRIYHQVSSSPGRFDHVDSNTALFLREWQDVTSSWGQREWASEYFQRYARHFWKMTPAKVIKAISLLSREQQGFQADPSADGLNSRFEQHLSSVRP